MRIQRMRLRCRSSIFLRRPSQLPCRSAAPVSGLLNGSTLYVAGSPVPPGTTSTFDAVNISNMTRITANSVPSAMAYHTTMALSHNNKLYIGANTCSNTVNGCLSVVNTSNYTADPPCRPKALSPACWPIREPQCGVRRSRAGYWISTTPPPIPSRARSSSFTGALYGIVQVECS